MSNDDEKGRAPDAAPRKKSFLSDDAVEEAKRAIIYGVGYKRPPEMTQFMKGQSGNPKGRPKQTDIGLGGDRSASALVLREAARPVTIREGDETKQIPAIEAVVRSQILSASKGNSFAQRNFIEKYDRAERERRREIMEEIERWKRYVDSYREAIAEAQRDGNPPPTTLPHPDDVFIDYEKGVRFIGPVDEAEAAKMEENCRVRDVLLMQDALDRRHATLDERNDPMKRPGSAMVFAHVLNSSVPVRYQLSKNEILDRVTRYEVVPKRELIKTVFRAWRSLGRKARRGMVFPPLRWAKQVVDQLADALDMLQDNRELV